MRDWFMAYRGTSAERNTGCWRTFVSHHQIRAGFYWDSYRVTFLARERDPPTRPSASWGTRRSLSSIIRTRPPLRADRRPRDQCGRVVRDVPSIGVTKPELVRHRETDVTESQRRRRVFMTMLGGAGITQTQAPGRITVMPMVNMSSRRTDLMAARATSTRPARR